MPFNSIDFFLFLPCVFLLYWFGTKRNIKIQNALLLVASCFFYGYWDWRFLLLIFVSAFVDYLVSIALSSAKTPNKRKWLLSISLITNLGLLGYFKYFNFFLESFCDTFRFFGSSFSIEQLDIILPVGISFYTFQTLSYTIDVYKGKLKPTHDFIAFFTYVSFFPQLVAGPIERATQLLPQFFQKRKWNNLEMVNGLRQILWGLFKKVVIADNCAVYVNEIFDHSAEHTGSTLLLGAVLFAFQIYGDFSGYSAIAIGTARLFGFRLMQNFAFPYFSRDIAEFWRRWHISLSTWFRDYLYIPLGGSRSSRITTIRNIFIIFLVSGFWHGANWKYLAWGALHALYFIPLLLLKKNRTHLEVVAQGKQFPSVKAIFQIFYTFLLTSIAWLFFRADNVNQALEMLGVIFSSTFFTAPLSLPFGIWILLAFTILLEWHYREKEFALQSSGKPIPLWRTLIDYLLISITFWAIIIWNPDQPIEFVYFQF